MEEETIKVRPSQVAVGDIGRIIWNLPKALWIKIKERIRKNKEKLQKEKVKKESRKESIKMHRQNKREKSKVRKFFASVINVNPKSAAKVVEREEEKAEAKKEKAAKKAERKKNRKSWWNFGAYHFTFKNPRHKKEKLDLEPTNQPEPPKKTDDKIKVVYYASKEEAFEMMHLLNDVTRAYKEKQAVNLEYSKKLFDFLNFNRQVNGKSSVITFNGDLNPDIKNTILQGYPAKNYMCWELDKEQYDVLKNIFDKSFKCL